MKYALAAIVGLAIGFAVILPTKTNFSPDYGYADIYPNKGEVFDGYFADFTDTEVDYDVVHSDAASKSKSN